MYRRVDPYCHSCHSCCYCCCHVMRTMLMLHSLRGLWLRFSLVVALVLSRRILILVRVHCRLVLCCRLIWCCFGFLLCWGTENCVFDQRACCNGSLRRGPATSQPTDDWSFSPHRSTVHLHRSCGVSSAIHSVFRTVVPQSPTR